MISALCVMCKYKKKFIKEQQAKRFLWSLRLKPSSSKAPIPGNTLIWFYEI